VLTLVDFDLHYGSYLQTVITFGNEVKEKSTFYQPRRFTQSVLLQVEYIWTQPLNGATILFAINRYLPPLKFIVEVVAFHSPAWSNNVRVLPTFRLLGVTLLFSLDDSWIPKPTDGDLQLDRSEWFPHASAADVKILNSLPVVSWACEHFVRFEGGGSLAITSST
jgi:Family of unknown function (DUF6533)